MTHHELKATIAGLAKGSHTRPIYLPAETLKPFVAATRAVAEDLRNNPEISDAFRHLEEASKHPEAQNCPHNSGVLLKLIDLAIAALPVEEPAPAVATPIEEDSAKSPKTKPVKHTT